MILDHISQFQYYNSSNQLFSHVINFIDNHEIGRLEKGRIEIRNGVYATIDEYTTKSIDEKFIECHKKYIDVQIILKGIEYIGICYANECMVIEEYDEKKDFMKLQGAMDFITVRPGFFTVFYPHDGHMPGLTIKNSPTVVKKVVFKVPL